MARSTAELARIEARRHSPRTFQSTDHNPLPSATWLKKAYAAYLANGGNEYLDADYWRDGFIRQWNLGATASSAGAAAFSVARLQVIVHELQRRAEEDAKRLTLLDAFESVTNALKNGFPQ
jgi:hypothetical protein